MIRINLRTKKKSNRRGWMLSIAAGMLVLLATSLAMAGEKRVIDGTDALPGEFPEVYFIGSISLQSLGQVRSCTGTLIHPEIILTAAHCIPKDPDALTAAYSGVSRDALGAPLIASIKKAHPLYGTFDSKDPKQIAYDFGIVVLRTAVKTIPAKLASVVDIMDRFYALLNELTVVGYGGKNLFKPDATTGVKRHGKTTGLGIQDMILITNGSKSGISEGDSGGPIFMTDKNGERRLIGVASAAPTTEVLISTGKPEYSYYAGIRPEIIEWIEKESGKKLSE